MKRFLFLTLLVGCNWTDFDNLADTTWVHAEEKPSIGSTDYAIALADATANTNGGGTLAVVSNDAPSYSTLEFDASGATKVGDNTQKLGVHFIASLGEQPILVSDGMGKTALVEKAIDAGQIAVFYGPSPQDAPFPAAGSPDAATFAGANLIVAAGPQLYTVTTTLTGMCMANDADGQPLAAAALAADATNLYVWTKTGVFFSYTLASLTACGSGTITPSSGKLATAFTPGTGARIHLSGNYAILAAHGDKSTSGQVVVADAGSKMQIGTTLAADGIRSSALGVFAGKTYLALGFPERPVNNVVTGQVELHAFDPATGMLTATAAETLNDAQPDTNEQFGRAVTVMKFGADQILVVAANSEIFAYYRTALYPDVR